ncbi:MAG: hypothetical protein ISR65_07430 [Bacteriovoracaceae bacterium]|nr:hypothetical protein [Bacteriovoracaceae bacterium]
MKLISREYRFRVCAIWLVLYLAFFTCMESVFVTKDKSGREVASVVSTTTIN